MKNGPPKQLLSSMKRLSKETLENAKHTVAVPLMILDPPEAPATILTSPLSSVTIVGDIEDMGRLNGRIKLAGEGGYPKALILPGVEKSSISLFMMIPVDSETNNEPKLWENEE